MRVQMAQRNPLQLLKNQSECLEVRKSISSAPSELASVWKKPRPGFISIASEEQLWQRNCRSPTPITSLGREAPGISRKDQFSAVPLQVSTRSSQRSSQQLWGRYVPLHPHWWRKQRPKWLKILPEARVKTKIWKLKEANLSPFI